VCPVGRGGDVLLRLACPGVLLAMAAADGFTDARGGEPVTSSAPPAAEHDQAALLGACVRMPVAENEIATRLVPCCT
jgi:hypothetical protein